MKLLLALVLLLSGIVSLAQNISSEASPVVSNQTNFDSTNPILGLNIFKKFNNRGDLINALDIEKIAVILGRTPELTIQIAWIQLAIQESIKKGLDQAFIYGRFVPIADLQVEISNHKAEIEAERKRNLSDADVGQPLEPTDIEKDVLLKEVEKLLRSIDEYYTHKHNLAFWLDREGLDFKSPREQVSTEDQEKINEVEVAEKYILEAISVLRNKIDNFEMDSRQSAFLLKQTEEIKFLYNLALSKAAKRVSKKFDIVEQDEYFRYRAIWQQLAFKAINRLRDNKVYTVEPLIDQKKLLDLFYFEFNYNEVNNVFLDANSRVEEVARILNYKKVIKPRNGIEEAFIYFSMITGTKYVPVADPSILTMEKFKQQLKGSMALPVVTSKFEMVKVGEKAYKPVLSCSYLFRI